MTQISGRTLDRRFVLWFVFAVPLFFPGVFLGQLPGSLAPGLGDTYVFFEPYTLSFYHSILRLENPFWDHHSGFGAPVLLTLGAGSLHPFHLLHLMLPDALAFGVGAWARFAFFGVFSFLYLRQCLVNPWIAAAAVTSLVYGSFFLNYANDIIGYVVVFFPFCLYCIERLNQELSLAPLLALSLGVCCLILGGFLSVIMYLLLALGVYTLAHVRPIKTLSWIALFGFAGVLLTLPALIEIFSFFPQSGFDPEKRRALFFYTPGLGTAFNLIFPSQFGDIISYRASGHRDFYGSLLGAGIFTVFVVAIGVLLNRHSFGEWPKRALFWVALLCFCLFAYFNLLGIKQALSNIPLINQHPLTRLQTLIAMASAFSSALFLDQWLKQPVRPQFRWVAMGTLVGAVLVVFGTYFVGFPSTSTSRIFGVLAIVSSACLVSLLWGYHLGPKLWLLSVAIVGLVTSLVYTHYIPYKDYYAKSSAIDVIQQQLEPGGRVLDVNNSLFNQTSIAYSIPSITSHWFTPEPMRELIRQTSDEPVAKALTFETLLSLAPEKAWPMLRRLHVQIVVLPIDKHQAWLDKDSADWRMLYRDPARNLAVVEVRQAKPNTAALMKSGLSGEGYHAYQEGAGAISFAPDLAASRTAVTIPARMYKGWVIEKGATHIASDSLGFIKITPDGTGARIVLRYFPPHFWTALLFGLGFFMACIAVFRKFGPLKRKPFHYVDS
jgi:hypothetical protein